MRLPFASPPVASFAALAMGLALVSAPKTASANGRFPEASQLVISADESVLSLRATFGLLQSFDGGKNWGWVCEEAMGFSGLWDPPIARYEDNSLLVGLPNGLRISGKEACDYASAGSLLDGHFISDVSVHQGTLGLAMYSDGKSASEYENRLFFRQLAGQFEPAMGQLPSDTTLLTLDMAPSDNKVIYLTGLKVGTGGTPSEGELLVSGDSGETFQRFAIPGADASHAPYLAAVSFTNPNRLYVRLAGAQGRLLQSDNGGQSWQERFSGKGPLAGFALRPDDTQFAVGGPADGISTGNSESGALSQVSNLTSLCLTWSKSHLYSCASLAKDGFNLGKSADGGKTFEPVFYAPCLAGPLPCSSASGVTKECTSRFDTIQKSLTTIDCATARARFETGGGAGASGQSGSGGTTEPDPDCTCELAAAGTASSRRRRVGLVAGLFSLALVAIGWRRRRRSKRR